MLLGAHFRSGCGARLELANEWSARKRELDRAVSLIVDCVRDALVALNREMEESRTK